MSIALPIYLAIAAGIVALGARYVRPIPARDGLVLILLPLVETGEALVRGFVFAPIDLAWTKEPLATALGVARPEIVSPRILYDLWAQMVPWSAAVREAAAHAEWPLWNPYIFGGTPLLGAYQPALFHPANVLGLLVSRPDAPGLSVSAVLLVAVVSTYLLARELSASREAALFGAAAWAYGAFFLFWLGWPIATAACGLPLWIVGARRLAAGTDGNGTALFVVGLALVALGGNPEVLLMGASAVFVLWLAFAWAHGRDRFGKTCGRTALALVVGAGLVAVQLLPFLDTLEQSSEFRARSEAGEANLGAATSLVRSDLLLENLVPFALGVDRAGDAPLKGPEPARATVWIGSFGLLAATAAIVGGGFGSVRFVLVGMAVVGVGLATYMPGFVDLLRAIPAFDLVRPRYGALWSSLALALLAAPGFDVLVSARRRRVALTAAAAIGIWLALVAWNWPRFVPEKGLDSAAVLRLTAAIVAPIALFGLAAALGVKRTTLGALAILALLVERQMEAGHLHRAVPRVADFPLVEPIARLRETAGPFRVTGTGSHLYPNLGTMWGLEDVRGYDPMSLGRLVDTFPAWADLSRRQIARSTNLRPMHSFLNVRFAFVDADTLLPDGWSIVWRRERVALAENVRVLPRAFAPREIRRVESASMVLDDLAERRDFEAVAWLEPVDALELGQGISSANGPCEVHAKEWGRRYRWRVRCDSESWIATSVPAWRGWQAMTATGELEMAIVNHAFLAFRVPGGESDVKLRYRPLSFSVGLGMTLTSLLIAIGTGIRRRSRASSGAAGRERPAPDARRRADFSRDTPSHSPEGGA
jgi:hypothetical protein